MGARMRSCLAELAGAVVLLAMVAAGSGRAACPGQVEPGDQQLRLTHDGLERTFEVHVPPGYSGAEPVPLVVNLHGRGSTGVEFASRNSWPPKADSEGFVLVHPNGVNKTWNGGDCCQYEPDVTDDVGFLVAMLDVLGEVACVNLSRVLVTGWSNGGFMANRLACEAAGRVAAVASYAGPVTLPCEPERAVPSMHYHGRDDASVPFRGCRRDGGTVGVCESARTTYRTWSGINGCSANTTLTLDDGIVWCEGRGECATGPLAANLCGIRGWGHDYPSAYYNFPSVLAADLFWDFFVGVA